MEIKESLYPVLPDLGTKKSAPTLSAISSTVVLDEKSDVSEKSGHIYRLQKISEVQQKLQDEARARSDLSKKYHKGLKMVNVTDGFLAAASTGMGVAGLTILPTIAAIPLVIGLEIGSIFTGALGLIGSQVAKILTKKCEKHEKIRILASAKINTINDHISKALIDDKVTDEEYQLILSEYQKYLHMKEEIRTNSVVNFDTNLLQKAKNDALEEFQKIYDNRLRLKK